MAGKKRRGADERWETVAEIAERLGADARTVTETLSVLGLIDSKVSSRGDGRDREYRSGAVLLVERELRSKAEFERWRAGA